LCKRFISKIIRIRKIIFINKIIFKFDISQQFLNNYLSKNYQMVILKTYTSNEINELSNLNSTKGKIIFDSTLNQLRFNNSLNYNNIIVSKDLSNNISNINSLSANTINISTLNTSTINTFTNLGINTSARDYGLEINHPLGNCLRLTYNDTNGNPNYKCDIKVTSNGSLTLLPVGNNPSVIMGSNISGHSLSLTKQNASNNTVDIMLSLTGLPNTTSSNGIGTGIEFSAVNSTYTIFTLGTFESYSTNINDNSETGAYRWRLANNGELSTVATLLANGNLSVSSLTQTSDIRLKENIINLDINFSKEKILKLEPKKYNLKNKNKECYGFIAQEVKEFLPNIIEIIDNGEFTDLHNINYISLIPHLVNCIKDLYSKINKLEILN
jgi:hypothetical protein